MALTKCHECGREISSEAKACPHCGAKPKKELSRLSIFLIAVVALPLLFALFGEKSTPEEKAANESRWKAEREQQSAAQAAILSVQKIARNPASVKAVAALTDEHGSKVCLEYTAQNGFGGTNREHVVFVDAKAHVDAATWNAQCTGSLYDHTDAANDALN